MPRNKVLSKSKKHASMSTLQPDLLLPDSRLPNLWPGRYSLPRPGGLGIWNSQFYNVMPFRASVHVKNFTSMSKLHNGMVAVCTPRSLVDWVTGLMHVSDAQEDKSSARSDGILWLYRSYMYAEMQWAGIKRLLTVSGKNRADDDLHRECPDQYAWMSRFVCTRTRLGTNVSALLMK